MVLRRSIQLLQNDLLFLVETFEDFRLHPVRDAKFYAEFFLAVVGLGVRDLDGSLSLFVVNERKASIEIPNAKADNGKKKLGVKLGISNGVKTEILEGLNEKQQVILQ